MSFSNKELQEKDFIQDNFRKNPYPGWVWFVVLICLGAIFWGGSSWYSKFMSSEIAKNPFLQVTNREFSIFLWQFPEYMRVNSNSKTNYLPGFQYENKISLVLNDSDHYVMAPPEVLFLYHTWSRLIRNEFIYRSISVPAFKEFLQYSEEWQPQYWPQAPASYVALVKSLPKMDASTDLNTLSEMELPLEVRQAFQGWKNYFKEGIAINDLKPTLNDVQEFLQKCPHYARNFWRNIVEKNYPDYLIGINLANRPEKQTINSSELTPFLRVGLYNFLQWHQEKLQNKLSGEITP
jgi:hypothetical protein